MMDLEFLTYWEFLTYFINEWNHIPLDYYISIKHINAIGCKLSLEGTNPKMINREIIGFKMQLILLNDNAHKAKTNSP